MAQGGSGDLGLLAESKEASPRPENSSDLIMSAAFHLMTTLGCKIVSLTGCDGLVIFHPSIRKPKAGSQIQDQLGS